MAAGTVSARRSWLHERLCEALVAQATTWQETDLRQVDGDVWHLARDPFGELGVEGVPAHLDHLALAVEFGRGRPTGEAQRRGMPALQETVGTLYLSFHYRPHNQIEDYRRAMDAAEACVHTLTGPWHGGAANVAVDDDWNPRLLPGEPVLLTTITFTLRHERTL